MPLEYSLWADPILEGDKIYDLFARLSAANLNVGIDNESDCITSSILAADNWMAARPVGSGVKAKSTDWKAIEATRAQLNAYNNGLLCASHRE